MNLVGLGTQQSCGSSYVGADGWSSVERSQSDEPPVEDTQFGSARCRHGVLPMRADPG